MATQSVCHLTDEISVVVRVLHVLHDGDVGKVLCQVISEVFGLPMMKQTCRR